MDARKKLKESRINMLIEELKSDPSFSTVDMNGVIYGYVPEMSTADLMLMKQIIETAIKERRKW